MRDLIHIHQTAELAERVLLPGDPGRAYRLAKALLQKPRMLNHNRGLWGYTGTSIHDDAPLSIQSTGMGGPSTAIVAAELIELGARRLVRVGTCGALVGSLALGQVVVVADVLCADGTSRALGGGPVAAATPSLLSALTGAETPATVARCVSSDLFYDADGLRAGWIADGASVVEMEAATLFTLAARRGVEAGCALLVSDLLASAPPARIGESELYEAELSCGDLVARALVAAAVSG